MSKFLFFDFNIPELVKDGDSAVGGATVQALNWIEGLKQTGHEVGVMVEKGQAFPKNSAITWLETFSLKSKYPFSWFYPRTQELNRAIRQYQPDYIVQAGAGFITFPIAFLAFQKGIPLIHRIANNADVDERVFKKASFFAVAFYRLGLRLTPIISCQTEYQLQKIKKRFGHKKVFKLHNPYTGSLISRENARPRSKRSYVAWLGIFQDQKNLPLLLEIARSLPEVQFQVAGKPKKGISQSLKETINTLESLPNVGFEGYLKRTEIQSFLANATCLLNTSHYEGFSNTFLEALAAGTPVVTMEETDPDGIIRKNQLGIVKGEPHQMVQAIEEQVQLENYEDLSQRCRAYVSTHHDRDMLAKKLADLLSTS